MIFYAIFIVSWAFLVLLSPLSSKSLRAILSIIFLGLLVTFTGLRYFSDSDYIAYHQLYESVPSLLDITLEDLRDIPFEWGFTVLNATFKLFIDEAYVFLFFLAAISILTKSYVASKFTEHHLPTLFLYLSFVYFNNEFIQIRWALSISFILLATFYFTLGRVMLAIMMCVISSYLHVTGVLFVLIFLLTTVLVKRVSYLFFMVMSIISFVFSSFFDIGSVLEILLSGNSDDNYYVLKIIGYLNSGESISLTIWFQYCLTYISSCVLYCLCLKRGVNNSSEPAIINFRLFALYSVIIWFCLFFSSFPILSQRIYIVALFMFSILTVRLSSIVFSDRSFKLILFFASCLSCLIFLLLLQTMFEKGNIYEYKTWLYTIG